MLHHSVAALLAIASSDGVYEDPAPGFGYFEDHVRHTSARFAVETVPALDVRVVKARGDRGYAKARLSVVSQGGLPEHTIIKGTQGGDVPFGHSVPFQHKWEGSFDLGSSKSSCREAPYFSDTMQKDAECLLACSHDNHCVHYTWYPKSKLCALVAAACTIVQDADAEATYAKYGTNFLTSAIVDLTSGVNKLEVAGTFIDVNLPAQGAGLRGVVIADPCFSSRWVGCKYAESWDTFNRTVLMLNALAGQGDIDFFALLGDNFYDQDGRLTSALWRSLSPAFKQTFLVTTPGNHDIWVKGGPGSNADEYDQYGYGFMQFYAQDSLAATGSDVFNFSSFPSIVDPTAFNNDPANFFLYHQLGNIGIIAYNGGGVSAEHLKPEFEQACKFMAEAQPDSIVLFGHWNNPTSGCPAGSDTPHIRDFAASLPGCAEFGDRLRFAEGHTHTNAKQGSTGFLIGGHGMSGAGQYGFMLLDSTAADLEVSYFEERSEEVDSFDNILACIRLSGASGCKHLAQQWLGGSESVV